MHVSFLVAVVAVLAGCTSPSRTTGADASADAALDEVGASWKRGDSVLASATLRAGAPTFAADLCALWKKEGRHQSAADGAQDAAFVRADPRLSSARLQEIFAAINACTRPRAAGAPMPAMWITFSAI